MPSPFRVQILQDVRGAYFRKVQTRAGLDYRGIRGVSVLPRVSLDPERQFVSRSGLDHFQTGPLDRPSVYMGGNAAGRELDAGLVWDRVYDQSGVATYTDLREGTDGRDAGHRFGRGHANEVPALSDGAGRIVATGSTEVNAMLQRLVPNFAFRPFWRTTNNDGKPWNQPRPGAQENQYFYPGEQVSMSVEVVTANEISLRIGSEQVTFAVTFRQIGFGVGRPQSFKRVNSIDQFTVDTGGSRVGLEGRSVLPTRASAVGANWLEVSVIRSDGSIQPMAGADFVEVRGGDVAPHYSEIFSLGGWNDLGSERIDISPVGS